MASGHTGKGTGPQNQSRIIRIIVAALLIDLLAFTIILPLFPRLLKHYELTDGPNKNSLYARISSIVKIFRASLGSLSFEGSRLDIIIFGGILGSMFSFLQFISSPIIGRLSDRYGRRPVLLLSMIGNAVSMGLWIFSKSFDIFVWSRIVGGLTEGNVQMSIAMISDATPDKDRSRALAWVGISFAIGFTFGPPLGAYLTSIDLHTYFPELPINSFSSPAIFAFILILVESMFLYLYLPETSGLKQGRNEEDAPLIEHDLPPSKSTRSALKRSEKESPAKITPPTKEGQDDPQSATLKQSTLSYLALVHFLFLFVFSGVEFTLTFLTYDRFKFENAQQGRLLGYMGIISALIQGGYVRSASRRNISEKRLILQGILALATGLLVLGYFAYDMKSLYAGVTCLAFTSGTVVTSLTSLASILGSSSTKSGQNGLGSHLGWFRATGQLGRALGPLTICFGYWALGPVTAFSLLSGFMIFLSVFVLFVLPDRRRSSVSALKKGN